MPNLSVREQVVLCQCADFRWLTVAFREGRSLVKLGLELLGLSRVQSDQRMVRGFLLDDLPTDPIVVCVGSVLMPREGRPILVFCYFNLLITRPTQGQLGGAL
jgi:hypothetical protein